MHTQTEIKTMFLPLLKNNGKVFKKFKKVYARKAKGGEKIDTITSDGKETTNIAQPGDYIVKNQTNSEEVYILTKKKFKDRYIYLRRSKQGFSEYIPIGKICALELKPNVLKKNKLKKRFYFEAPWGAKMVAKENDYLVCPPNFNEVYRIARKEFFETYQPE